MTNTANNGLGMGVAVIFVLALSNVIISLFAMSFRKRYHLFHRYRRIPGRAGNADGGLCLSPIPTIGIFVPLIVVNCIILGRAEAFAAKNCSLAGPGRWAGHGHRLYPFPTFLGAIRETFGAGALFGVSLFGPDFKPFTFMVQAPGAFVCLGLIRRNEYFGTWQAKRKGVELDPNFDAGCAGCAACKAMDKMAAQKKLERLQPAKG